MADRLAWLATTAALCACGPRAAHLDEPTLAAAGIHRLRLATGDAHGLSGLAVDADGALWTVAERARAAFRIVLDRSTDPPTVASLARWPVRGLPAGRELESLAIEADGTFVVGVEGTPVGAVEALRLVRGNGWLEVSGPPLGYDADALGLADAADDVGDNHGVEGACATAASGPVLAVEVAGHDAVGRWAPLVRPAAGLVQRVRLTSDKGKLSALDCWQDGDRVRVVAIERHFAVTRVLGFELGDGPELATTVLRDLAPALRGALNLEGLVRLPDGHLVAVVDNHYGHLTGPDELLWLEPIAGW